MLAQKNLFVILYRYGSLEAAAALLNTVRYESLAHLIKSSHICGHLSVRLSVCASVSRQPPPVKRLAFEEGVKCALETECD